MKVLVWLAVVFAIFIGFSSVWVTVSFFALALLATSTAVGFADELTSLGLTGPR